MSQNTCPLLTTHCRIGVWPMCPSQARQDCFESSASKAALYCNVLHCVWPLVGGQVVLQTVVKFHSKIWKITQL